MGTNPVRSTLLLSSQALKSLTASIRTRIQLDLSRYKFDTTKRTLNRRNVAKKKSAQKFYNVRMYFQSVLQELNSFNHVIIKNKADHQLRFNAFETGYNISNHQRI